MLMAIICLFFSGLWFKKQIKGLTARKDKIVFAVSFLLAVGLVVAFCFDYPIPTPVEALKFIYQPLSSRLLDFLQKYQTG